MYISSLLSVFLISAPAWGQSLSNTPCPIGGPDYPAPSSLSKSSPIINAAKNVASSIAAAQANGTVFGSLDPQSFTFVVDVYSLHDQDSLFSHTYTAPNLGDPTTGVKTVDANTIFRIGSTSKLWTTYVYLIEAGFVSFNDPITKYVPELAPYANKYATAIKNDGVNYFDWNSITVGAIASHLASIPRDAAPGPAQNAKFAALGLPPVKAQNVSWCGNPNVIELPCKRSDFFTDLLVRSPVVAPFRTPIYSNAAFQILSYALENITSKAFPTMLSDTLIKPLGLNATSYTLPASNKTSYIPYNATISWYNTDIVDETPAGGFYSSLNDMRKIGKSILNSTFLTPSQTRQWLKPHSFINPTSAVGAPWEIFLAPSNQSVWLYTKSGDLGLYSGMFVLIPDYNFGFNILGAGMHTHSSVATISSIISTEFIPALEAAAKSAANTKYSGTYTDAKSNSSITITTTPSDPGLVVTSFTAAGKPVLSLLGSLLHASSSQTVSMHLYPADLHSTSSSNATEAWRAVYEALPIPANPGVFSGCQNWFMVDQITYGTHALDEFHFVLSPDGSKVVGIEAMALGLALSKTDAAAKSNKEKRGFVRMLKQW